MLMRITLSIRGVMLMISMTLVIHCRLSPERAKNILHLHNLYRENVQPAASNMREIVWSKKLEREAQQYANTCPHSHSSAADQYGENIVFGSPDIDIKGFHSMWMEEESIYYDIQNGGICHGPRCGHYVQMITADVSEMGCGVQKCKNIHYGRVQMRDGEILVCRYNVPVYENQLPYQISSIPCSVCPQGTVCSPGRNLCSSTMQPFPSI
jgi:hypothetical protein